MPERRNEVVLISSDDFHGALAGVRGLRAYGYRPWVGRTTSVCYASRSRAAEGVVRITSPALSREGFAAELAAAAHRTGAAAVLPGSEAALLALSGEQERFSDSVLGAPPRALADRATDKAALADVARDVGLLVPDTTFVDPTRLEGVPLPAIVKPAHSVATTAEGGFAVTRAGKVGTRDELRSALGADSHSAWLVQPWIEGELAAVSGVAWQGRIVCSAQQRALRTFPTGTGTSAFAETVDPDPDLGERVAALVAALQWSGVFQLQLLRAADGFYAIDFNPRMYGSMALAIAAGLNLPGIWTDLLLGREPRVGAARTGMRYRMEEKDVRALAALATRGRIREALLGALPRRRTTHAVARLGDMRPVGASLEKLLRGSEPLG